MVAIIRRRGTSAIAALLLCILDLNAHGQGIINPNPHESNSLNLLAYNIFMRPTTTFFNAQKDRANAIPTKVRNFDAILFSEAFDDGIRQQLLDDLVHEYPYRTRIVGSDRFLEQDGGVILVSRWPIEVEDQVTFGSVCSGKFDDCLADKGVLYARLHKHGFRHHIFGSHTQAGESDDRKHVRLKQFGIIKAFIDSKNIPETEPVYIAGDLNVDRHNRNEFSAMLRTLNASVPTTLGHPYTLDPNINTRSSGRKYLDYVLISNEHAQPVNAELETLLLKSSYRIDGSYDLSDHFPVFGHITLPSSAEVMATTIDR